MNKLWKKLPALLAFSFFAVSFAACGKESALTSSNETVIEATSSETEISESILPEKAEAETQISESTTSETTETDQAVDSQKETAKDESVTDTETAFPSSSGKLHVEGINICDENGRVVQLKGLSTHGIAWFPQYIDKELFSEFRNEWNCNIVRIAMYSDEYGGYANGGDKAALKKLVKDGVNFATENDMYVIIDWHILADSDPNRHKEEAKEFFSEMSKLYANNNNVLYEICNEPNGGTDWGTIKKYAEEVIPVIRSNDEDAIIIVGTPTWSQEVDKAAKDPIRDYSNIMYALHFYADTHKDDLRNRMVAALKDGLPIFVTEYGICDASGNGAINEAEAAKWMSVMNEYKISSCAWNISNKSETSAIFASWTSKTHGFSDEDLSSSGKWIYSMLTGKTKYEPSKTQDEISQSSKQEEKESGEVTKETDVTKIECGNLTAVLKLVNSWEDEEGTFGQYELTIVNNAGAVTEWSVYIPFEAEITLTQGWCAVYSLDGKVLHITNESYNGSLEKGASTKDIGFIVAGKQGISIER